MLKKKEKNLNQKQIHRKTQEIQYKSWKKAKRIIWSIKTFFFLPRLNYKKNSLE